MAKQTYRGRFLWYELLAKDTAGARKFYTDLVGWGTQQWEGSDPPYQMWTNQGEPLAGLMQLPEEAQRAGAPSHWLTYIATPDVEETREKAEQLGATILVELIEVPEVGRFSIMQDPHGAVFAAYTPAEEPSASDPVPQVGEFSWHELATTDHEAAFDFYHKLFGWEKTDAMDMGEAGIYQMYGRSEAPLGGMYDKPAEMPAPPHWLFYIKVPDVNQAVAKVKQLGGQVLNGPMEVPGGDLVAQCMDPGGAAFAMHSTKS